MVVHIAFLALKWPFSGQPDNHKGWASSMAFSSNENGLNQVIFSKWKLGGFEIMTFSNPPIFNSKVQEFKFPPFYDYYDFQTKIKCV